MGDVVPGHFITSLKIRPDSVIDAAGEWGLSQVVIVGFKEDGDFYFASSEPDSPSVLHMLIKAQHELMKIEDRIALEGDPRG